MTKRIFRIAAVPALMLTTVAMMALHAGQPAGTGARDRSGEWTYYGGDARNWRYKPFDQINASNFNSLQVAWRFKTDNLGPSPDFRLGATPIMANGVVYAVGGGMRRSVVAFDAATGALLWIHQEDEGLRAEFAPRVGAGRGVTYWTDGREERIFYVTTGYRLKALSAKTGAPVLSFGDDGVIDLKKDFDQDLSRFAKPYADALTMADIGLHASPVVGRDTIVVGAAGREGTTPFRLDEVKGYVRAFDVRTGKRLWTFHTIPTKGEFGYDTWQNGSAERTGHVGVWTQMAIDEELGMVYLPVETPTNDYYGGGRPGNNLFAESLVALDLKTGQRKWHFQIVHHPLWDYDLSSAPILADITVNGRAIKAVAMPSKQSFLYVFDRVTGQPVWPIEERPVAKGNVPGEWYAPTQPYPTKPPAYARQSFTTDELIDFTPELRAKAVEIASKFALSKLFEPPVLSKPDGPYKSLTFSTALGGTNWPGGSYDPETHTVYASANQQIVGLGVVPVTDKRFSEAPYVGGDELAGVRDVYGHSGDGPRLNGGRPPEKPAAPGNPSPPPGMGAGFLACAERGRTADQQAALRCDLRDQSRSRRDHLAGAAWRYARPDPESSGAQGPEHRAHRPADERRHARHQNACRCRRAERHDSRTSARRPTARVRQELRQGRRRRTDGSAADRIVHDLHVARQAVHRRRHQRAKRPWSVRGVRPARCHTAPRPDRSAAVSRHESG